MKQEVEVKLPIRDPARIRETLHAIGAHFDGEADEANTLFDRDGELAARGEVLRLRQDRRVWITWKGPATNERGVKSRAEAQTTLADFDAGRVILERLGFRPVISYAKHREMWDIDGVEVTIDRLAFGDFVEIEGEAAAIERVVARLGLDLGAAVDQNYVELQHAYQTGGPLPERFADA